ncbi:hypothetical protein G6F70_008920 [Rhizopus microsporus]|nr:hypothetical protein G6F71_008883 [Rhizopus microsporus]KAG1194134.1 hypothetical protein G6F70_008920 [Rhizopus microsporus]KAG1206347.1 hypothetical protein G6F69_008903 [Rhizopus microsporus]KAG1258388.1 hypothetical protein G6F68_008799 [Rhizopus microsporus]
MYYNDINFGQQGLYYDVKRNTINHFKAFYQLPRLFERLCLSVVNYFPLWRSWSPRYARVVDLDSKALKPQEGGQLRFRGTIQTDGAGVTVLKKRFDRQIRYTARFTVEYETISYITNLTRRNHQEISGRCVAVEPGRRDMLYCVHESSTPEQPVQFRYIKQQQDKTWKTKKYRQILQDLKAQDPDVVQDESEQSVALSDFYGHTIMNHDLRAKCGEDAVFVMGNWSAPHARYHELIGGLGFQRLLKKHGFQVFLIDKYKTSRCCPTCHNESLHTFRSVPNSRSYRRQQYPTVIYHGLLIPAMAAPDRYRLWNRDVAACLNYMHILRGLRRNGMVPDRFRRDAVAPTRR